MFLYFIRSFFWIFVFLWGAYENIKKKTFFHDFVRIKCKEGITKEKKNARGQESSSRICGINFLDISLPRSFTCFYLDLYMPWININPFRLQVWLYKATDNARDGKRTHTHTHMFGTYGTGEKLRRMCERKVAGGLQQLKAVIRIRFLFCISFLQMSNKNDTLLSMQWSFYGLVCYVLKVSFGTISIQFNWKYLDPKEWDVRVYECSVYVKYFATINRASQVQVQININTKTHTYEQQKHNQHGKDIYVLFEIMSGQKMWA